MFLKRWFVFVILGVLGAYFNASVCAGEQQPPLTDVLTLVKTFGGKNDTIPGEFKFVNPWDIDINTNGDIFIADEARIKVFYKDGKGKAIIGGPGEGPGEFGLMPRSYNPIGEHIFKMDISPTGYLSVFKRYWRRVFGLIDSYNIFAPDHSFITEQKISNNAYLKEIMNAHGYSDSTIIIAGMTTLNESEKVYHIDVAKTTEGASILFELLVYEDAQKVTLFYEREKTGFIVATRKRVTWSPEFGEFFWCALSNGNIIFTHTGYDMQTDESESQYILHMVSPETFQETHITHRYTPDKKQKNLSPIIRLLADGNYIFVFRNQMNDKNEYLADVFDGASGEFVRSVYFPFWLGRELIFVKSIIKYGFVYKLVSYIEYGIIEKYKINPAVYGK